MILDPIVPEQPLVQRNEASWPPLGLKMEREKKGKMISKHQAQKIQQEFAQLGSQQDLKTTKISENILSNDNWDLEFNVAEDFEVKPKNPGRLISLLNEKNRVLDEFQIVVNKIYELVKKAKKENVDDDPPEIAAIRQNIDVLYKLFEEANQSKPIVPKKALKEKKSNFPRIAPAAATLKKNFEDLWKSTNKLSKHTSAVLNPASGLEDSDDIDTMREQFSDSKNIQNELENDLAGLQLQILRKIAILDEQVMFGQREKLPEEHLQTFAIYTHKTCEELENQIIAPYKEKHNQRKILRDNLTQDWNAICKKKIELSWEIDWIQNALDIPPRVKSLKNELEILNRDVCSLAERASEALNPPSTIKPDIESLKQECARLEAHCSKAHLNAKEQKNQVIYKIDGLSDQIKSAVVLDYTEFAAYTPALKESIQKEILEAHKTIQIQRINLKGDLISDWNQIQIQLMKIEAAIEWINNALNDVPELENLAVDLRTLFDAAEYERRSGGNPAKMDRLIAYMTNYKNMFDEFSKKALLLKEPIEKKIESLNQHIKEDGNFEISAKCLEPFAVMESDIKEKVQIEVRAVYKDVYQQRINLRNKVSTIMDQVKKGFEEVAFELEREKLASESNGVFLQRVLFNFWYAVPGNRYAKSPFS